MMAVPIWLPGPMFFLRWGSLSMGRGLCPGVGVSVHGV